MNLQIALIQNFLIAVGLVSSVVVIIYLIHNLLKKHKQITSEEPDLATGYKKILKTANHHAKAILQETTIEASNILSGTRNTNEKITENLDAVLQSIAKSDIQSLKGTTQNFEKEYNEKINTMQQQIDQALAEVLANTQKAYNDKLDKFTGDLLKTSTSTQETVDKKTAELVAKAQSDIEEYKKEQIQKIETDAKTLLEKVYKDVLRKSIPENLHKELILNSLEEAKKDGLFKL